MALNIFTGSATSNWGTSASWSLNRVPNATDLDTVYFGTISPTCSVDVTNAPCYNWDSSTYTRQIVFNQNVRIFGTYSNFGGGSFRFTNTNNTLPGSLLRIDGTCSITSNGFVIPSGFITFGLSNDSYTITLLDQLTADNIFFSRSAGTTTITVNGSTMSARSSFNNVSNLNLRGTSNIELRGTASNTTVTFTTIISFPITNSLFINTPGSATLNPLTIQTNNNIVKWISGTLSITTFNLVQTGNTITYDNASNTVIGTLNTGSNNAFSMTFSSVYPLNVTNLTLNQPAGSTIANFNFYGGWSVSNITHINSNTTNTLNINLSPTASWYVNNSITLQPQRVNSTNLRIQSTQPGTKAPLIISYNATQDIFNTLFVDIDASGGATILPYQYNATFSNVSNILDLKSWYIQTNQIQIN